MKKQTLFDLTSMPKMILIIALVIMLGTLFGATSYLLKMPKIETQCEASSDCELINTGSDICSCDTSLREYKCFSLEKVAEIKNERKKQGMHVQCAECFGGPQHVCEYANGKCEKVKEELAEEVVITTDKMDNIRDEITKNIGYKKFILHSLESEVPENWSVLRIPEMFGRSELSGMPTGAIGTDDITHGDLNWEQVNFYFASQDIIDELIKENKNNNYNTNTTWSNEIVGGIESQVNTFPLDENGKVSKGGTGGKKYYIKLPYSLKTLVIWKQAKGGAEFEKGFENFIKNVKFEK